MDALGSLGDGTGAAQAPGPLRRHDAGAPPATPKASDAGTTRVSLSDEGRARVDDAARGTVHAVAQLAHAVVDVADEVVGDAVHAVAGYVARTGLAAAQRLDELA